MPYTILDVTCTAETDKAILCESPNLEEPWWVPISQVHDDSEVYKKGHEGTLVITDWLAKQAGFI